MSFDGQQGRKVNTPEFGSLIDQDDPTTTPLQLANVVRNMRFNPKSIATRYGLSQAMIGTVGKTINGLAMVNVISGAETKVPLAFDSGGHLKKESPSGSGTMVELLSGVDHFDGSPYLLPNVDLPTVVLPTDSFMQAAVAYSRAFAVFGDRVRPLHRPAVYNALLDRLDPISDKLVGDAWQANRDYRVGQIVAVSSAVQVVIPPEDTGSSNAAMVGPNSSSIPDGTTVNAAQWEIADVSPHQWRTAGGSGSLPPVLDWVYAHNFNISLPADAIITGIKVEVQGQTQYSAPVSYKSVRLYSQASAIGTEKAPATPITTSPQWASYGGDGDMWGCALTPAIVNDPSFGFGVQIAVQGSRVFLNGFRITIYYNFNYTIDKQVTVPGRTMPWSFTGGMNVAYQYGTTPDGTAPIVALTTLQDGLTVLVDAVEGEVRSNSSSLPFDAAGDPATITGSTSDANGTFPTAHMAGSTLGRCGLCGAFTDAAGNVVQPISIGKSARLTVPVGATRLQFGIDDNTANDNTGSFTVRVRVIGGPAPEPAVETYTEAKWFRCLRPGVTGSNAPAWPDSGTVADNGVLWQENTPSASSSSQPGNVDIGVFYMVVLFKNQNGYTTGMGDNAPVLVNVEAEGFRLDVVNIPIGPENTVARIIAFGLPGDVSLGRFFYILDDEKIGDAEITKTVIPDNTTTTATFNFTSDFLKNAVDVSEYFDKIEVPECLSTYFAPSLSRIIYAGCKGFESGYLISQQNDPETITSSGILQVAQGDGGRAIAWREINTNQYALKDNGGHQITPSSTDPSGWGANRRWDGHGPCNPAAIDGTDDFFVYAHKTGFYRYNESGSPLWMSEEIANAWKRINWDKQELIWVHIDIEAKEIRIGVPYDGSVICNKVLTLNYFQGWERPSIFRGAVVPGRRWALDDIAANCAMTVVR
jgi:hypothetical protein